MIQKITKTIKSVFNVTMVKKSRIYFLMFLQLLSGLILILKLNAISQLVNHLIEGNYKESLWVPCAVVVLTLVEILMERFVTKYRGVISLQQEILMKKKFYKKIRSCYMRDIDKKSNADILTRFNDDIGNIINFLVNTYTIYLANLFKLFLILFYIGLNNRLLLLFVIVMPVMLGLSKHFGEKSGEEYAMTNRCKSDMNIVGMNMIEYRENIRNMNAGKFFAARYLRKENDYVKHEKKRTLFNMAVWISGVAGYQAIYLLIYVIGGLLAYHGVVQLGILVSAFTVIDPMVDIVMGLPGIVPSIYGVKSNLNRYEEIVTMREKQPVTVNCEGKTEIQNMIEYKDVSYAYDDKLVLDQVSLSFHINDHVAIVGKSGSGKSTLLKLLMGYDDSYNGVISMNAKDIKEMSDDEMRDFVSFVPQEVFLQTDTIKNNILAVGTWDKAKIESYAQIADVSDDISNMAEGYNTLLENGGENISLGQKKRLGILMALNRNKKMMILDETLSSVDKKSEIKIINNIFDKLDIGLVLVTHRVSKELLEKYDKVVLMDQGKIAACGLYHEISEIPLMKELEKESMIA